MEFTTHTLANITITEVSGEGIFISSVEGAMNLLGNLYYQGTDGIVLYGANLTPDFFDLKNGLAGEILQKFSNYRMPLVIVGDVDHFTSKSLRDFIRESNDGRQINFVTSLTEALRRLSQH